MIELAILLFAPVALSYVTRKALTWLSATLSPRSPDSEHPHSSQGTA